MSIWLNPTGKSTFGIGICDRCKEKMSLEDLFPDPNAPGLRVCLQCRDVFDPYRLPARVAENISLPFTRPDEPLTNDPDSDVLAFVLGVGADDELALGTESGEAIQVTGVPS